MHPFWVFKLIHIAWQRDTWNLKKYQCNGTDSSVTQSLNQSVYQTEIQKSITNNFLLIFAVHFQNNPNVNHYLTESTSYMSRIKYSTYWRDFTRTTPFTAVALKVPFWFSNNQHLPGMASYWAPINELTREKKRKPICALCFVVLYCFVLCWVRFVRSMPSQLNILLSKLYKRTSSCIVRWYRLLLTSV